MYVETRRHIAEMVNQDVFPGATYLFYREGQQLVEQVGYKQLIPKKEVLTRQTSYDMASLTKVMMTNTVVLQLLEEGIIELDEPICTYLPDWHENTVTLRHLLTHTSGINPFIKNRNELDADALKQALHQLPVTHSFEKEKVYTDTGTLLIGFMIEHLLGEPVQTICEKRVLKPLDMLASSFNPLDKKNVAPTEVTEKRGLIQGEVHDPKANVLKEMCGSAGLFSTIDDTWKFTKMMLNRGVAENGRRLLKEETVLSLLQDWSPNQQFSRSLGWDLFLGNSEEPILFHTGYTGTFQLIDVQGDEAFIFLSNRVHPTDKRTNYLKHRDELLQIYEKERRAFRKNDIL